MNETRREALAAQAPAHLRDLSALPRRAARDDSACPRAQRRPDHDDLLAHAPEAARRRDREDLRMTKQSGRRRVMATPRRSDRPGLLLWLHTTVKLRSRLLTERGAAPEERTVRPEDTLRA